MQIVCKDELTDSVTFIRKENGTAHFCIFCSSSFVALKRAVGSNGESLSSQSIVYLELVYLVTALVPSETACFANSPGRMSRTAVWISRDEIVDRLL